MKRVVPILVGIIFVIIGVFMFISGRNEIKKCTEEAVGTVVDIKEEMSTDSDGFDSYTYYPVIEYKVGDRIVTKQSKIGSNPSKYGINDKVDILYNPNNVEEYIIKGDKSSILFSALFVSLGTIAFVAGIIKRY